MRKHNSKFATRWSREKGDRSNFPQRTAHSFVNSKFAQFSANSLLQSLFLRAGCLKPAPTLADEVDAALRIHEAQKPFGFRALVSSFFGKGRKLATS